MQVNSKKTHLVDLPDMKEGDNRTVCLFRIPNDFFYDLVFFFIAHSTFSAFSGATTFYFDTQKFNSRTRLFAGALNAVSGFRLYPLESRPLYWAF